MMYPGMYYYMDPTYLLIIAGVALSMLASYRVKSVYGKYGQIRSRIGLTGKEAAERILQANGIYDVRVHHIPGNLTDHYDPRNKTLGLSDATYASASVAAIGVAAHECGHAIQHARNYAPLAIRGALVPVANFGSALSWPLVLVGLFMRGSLSALLIQAGILLFLGALLFQIVTLPVEFNASSNALRALLASNLLVADELRGVRAVLRAAAMTYVAAVLASMLQLLRLLILSGNRRER